MLTCDGPEAEIATPPIVLSRGFLGELDAWTGAGASLLADLLPEGVTADGCSTHLSVSIDDGINVHVCRLFAYTFSPALMLLMDHHESPGLLIRPRHGRVEFGGDYVSGSSLSAAAMMAVGGVRACADVYRRRLVGARGALPRRLDVRVLAADDRFGWYIDRAAFGADLYAGGRTCRLKTADAGFISSQDQLEAAWSVAVSWLDDDVDSEDIAKASRLIHGLDPLPIEAGPSRPPARHRHMPTSAQGRALEPVSRPGFTAEAAIATWDVTIFRLVGRRGAFAAVPRSYLPSFLTGLRNGMLDDAIEAYLAAAPSGRKLESHSEAITRLALYDTIGWAPALLAPERDRDGVPRAQVASESPNRTRLPSDPTSATTRQHQTQTREPPDRLGKGLQPSSTLAISDAPGSPRRPSPMGWAIGIGAAVIIALITILVVSRGESPTVTTALPVATQKPTTTSTGSVAPTADPATPVAPTSAAAETPSTATATTPAVVTSSGASLPFSHAICELSEPSGVSVIDCPPELTVNVLTAESVAAGELAVTIKTDAGLLASDEPNSSISMRMFGTSGELYECFVRGTGEAMCRGFGADFQEMAAPTGAGAPGWDSAAETFTIDGLEWTAGVLTWHGSVIVRADLFLRSRVDPNRTATIALALTTLGDILSGAE